jgi:hypothetical protein
MYKQKYIKYKNKYTKLAKQMNQKIYLIHDNGGRPFKVIINGDEIAIYKKDKSNTNNDGYMSEPIMIFKPEKIFIGKNSTGLDNDDSNEFDGNTILLHMGLNKYIHIGEKIFSFDADNKITFFVSPIGNNDVPYPYAVDELGNWYLLIEYVIIEKNNKTEKQMKQYHEPYQYYYDFGLITIDRGTIPPTKPKIKNFNGIEKFYIGSERYTLRYRPNPADNYDDLQKRFNQEPLYIVDINNKKIELTKQMYIELMESFGKMQSFKPMSNVSILKNRDLSGTWLGYYIQNNNN